MTQIAPIEAKGQRGRTRITGETLPAWWWPLPCGSVAKKTLCSGEGSGTPRVGPVLPPCGTADVEVDEQSVGDVSRTVLFGLGLQGVAKFVIKEVQAPCRSDFTCNTTCLYDLSMLVHAFAFCFQESLRGWLFATLPEADERTNRNDAYRARGLRSLARQVPRGWNSRQTDGLPTLLRRWWEVSAEEQTERRDRTHGSFQLGKGERIQQEGQAFIAFQSSVLGGEERKGSGN